MMNSFERKQLKRTEGSRQKWKSKALERQRELRKLKTTIRDLKKSRESWKDKYLNVTQEAAKSPSAPSLEIPHFF